MRVNALIPNATVGKLVAEVIGETTVWARCTCGRGHHRRVEHVLWEIGAIEGCYVCDPMIDQQGRPIHQSEGPNGRNDSAVRS